MLPVNRFFPDVYSGLAASTVTSGALYVGDAHMVSWSLVSSSATASKWTPQYSNEDGFTAAIDESSWVNGLAASAPGLYGVSAASIPRWLRFQRTPSNSSSTVALSYRIGP